MEQRCLFNVSLTDKASGRLDGHDLRVSLPGLDGDVPSGHGIAGSLSYGPITVASMPLRSRYGRAMCAVLQR